MKPEQRLGAEPNAQEEQASPEGSELLTQRAPEENPAQELWRCASCFEMLSPGVISCHKCGARPSQDPLLGRVLIEKYVLQRKVGEGGFGAVYEAGHLLLESKVAIKVLRQQKEQTSEAVERFRREALATSRLTHPHAVKVYDRGETPDGLVWIAMEFLTGETLQSLLRRGALSEPAFLEHMGPVFEVLQEAHEKGIIHRDLKPENIMMVSMPDGGSIAKVLDFGIAGLIDSDTLTQTNMVSGTPKYMPPEQWEGLKNADARSDIYSLGVVAYKSLSGRFPFEADSTLSWMKKHYSEPPLDLTIAMEGRPVSAAFNEAVMRSLSKKAEDRQQTVKEFWRSLKSRGGSPSERTTHDATPTPVLLKQKSPRARSKSMLLQLGAALLLGGLVFWLLAAPNQTALSTPPTKPVLASQPRQGATQEATSQTSSAPNTPPSIAVGKKPFGVAVGDLNRDGHIDVAVANAGSDNVGVLLGNGDGTFQSQRTFTTDTWPQGIVIADFNSDEKLDIAVAHEASQKVGVFLGKGDGSFQSSQMLASGIQCVGLVAADFNRDGHVDLAATNARALSSNGTVSVFIGEGDGTFQPQQTLEIGTHPNFVTAADFNGDSKLDLVATNQLNPSGQVGSTLSLLLGNGNGTFQVYREINVGAQPIGLATEDFNHDGNVDIAVANSSSDNVGVLLGKGDGSFQAQATFDVGLSPYSIVAKDFNGDGEIDLATANNGSRNATILLGNGNGTFRGREDFPLRGNRPVVLSSADFNGDGAPDLVVSNSGGGSNDLRFLFSLFR